MRRQKNLLDPRVGKLDPSFKRYTPACVLRQIKSTYSLRMLFITSSTTIFLTAFKSVKSSSIFWTFSHHIFLPTFPVRDVSVHDHILRQAITSSRIPVLCQPSRRDDHEISYTVLPPFTVMTAFILYISSESAYPYGSLSMTVRSASMPTALLPLRSYRFMEYAAFVVNILMASVTDTFRLGSGFLMQHAMP